MLPDDEMNPSGETGLPPEGESKTESSGEGSASRGESIRGESVRGDSVRGESVRGESAQAGPEEAASLGARAFGESVHFNESSSAPERPAEERPPARSLHEREVKVLNVFQYDERSEYTFVLLQDGRGRKLPIFIGQAEALAIYIALQKENRDFHRPLTHDLLKNIIEKLGGRVERLTIDDMWQDTFYARLVLKVGEEWVDIDCRPSDGIAVALRAQCPIYVAEEVLDACRLAED